MAAHDVIMFHVQVGCPIIRELALTLEQVGSPEGGLNAARIYEISVAVACDKADIIRDDIVHAFYFSAQFFSWNVYMNCWDHYDCDLLSAEDYAYMLSRSHSTRKKEKKMDGFPKEIHEELDFYVYRLIDPRDRSTFYVGKGSGNRVFAHIKEELQFNDEEGPDEYSDKIRTIREIKCEGLEPIHIIHRHGMTEDEAFEVESALIDATPDLTNKVAGHGLDRGPATATQLRIRYAAEVMDFHPDHKVMAIIVSRSYRKEVNSLYEAVRCAWRVSLERANKADYILAVTDGICLEVFEPEKWLPATTSNFPRLSEDMPGRRGFVGAVAAKEMQDRYKGKHLPECMQRKKGMASPFMYNYE